eukprot:g73016.t1
MNVAELMKKLRFWSKLLFRDLQGECLNCIWDAVRSPPICGHCYSTFCVHRNPTPGGLSFFTRQGQTYFHLPVGQCRWKCVSPPGRRFPMVAKRLVCPLGAICPVICPT